MGSIRMALVGNTKHLGHLIVKALQALAVIAFLVFLIMPLRTIIQVLLCGCSLLIALILSILSGHLDNTNTGYWPDKPKL
jgi:hypothetical protein